MSLRPRESTYNASVDAEITKNESLQKRLREGLMNDRALLTPRNTFQAAEDAILSDEDVSAYKASVEESLQNVINEIRKNEAIWDEGKGRRAREDADEIRKEERLHKRSRPERLMNYHALLTSARKEFEDAWASRNNVPATSQHTGQATLLIVKLLASPRADVRQLMIQTLPMLECLINLNEDSILIDTCCVLSRIADGTYDIQQVSDDGLHSCLLKLLGNRPSLHLPAFPKVSKIFAGDDSPTQSLVDAKVMWSLLRLMKDSDSKFLETRLLPFLKEKLISSKDKDVLRVACWVLSYISDDIDDIQEILDADVCQHLVVNLLRDSSDRVLYPALRTVSNIFAGCTVTNISPPYNGPKNQTVIDANIIWNLISHMDTHWLRIRLHDFLKKILKSSTDEDVLRVACMALSLISVMIEGLVDADLCRHLVDILRVSSDCVLYPALRTVSNVLGGFSYEVQFIIDAQALPALFTILSENCWEYIKLQALAAILRIIRSDTPPRQIQSVIDAGIIAPLIHVIGNDALADRTRVLAARAIYRMTKHVLHIDSLVKRDCIEAMCNALSCPCITIVTLCLESLENILVDGEFQKKVNCSENNRYAEMVERIKGFEKIEKVKHLISHGITERGPTVLETLLSGEIR